MAEVYKKNIFYSLLRPVVDWNTRYSFRKVEIRGVENIPDDGAIILAPNHCNTLMDALVILRSYKGPTIFGARADLFNNRMIAAVMTFLKIIPMVRQRDGLRNVLKNVETQDTIIASLKNDVRVCIFPEGTHRPVKSLLPLKKGIFRTALAADDAFGEEKPVYIVPVGLEYGDFFRYRSTSLVTYGRPINVTEFIKASSAENEAHKTDALRKELTHRLSELFTYIPDSGNVPEKWTLAKMISISSERKPYGNFGTSLHDCMLHNRTIIGQIEKACSEYPERMQDIFEDVKEFECFRKKDRISIYSFRRQNARPVLAGKAFAALVGLPYFIYSLVACLPMWTLELWIRSKVKDRAFRNTASFGVKLAAGLIWFVISVVLAYCLVPWIPATILLLLAIPSYSYFHDYVEGMRRFISDIRIMRCKRLRKRFKSILKKYNEL